MRKLIILGTVSAIVLSGCTVGKINYDGKKRTYDETEELIEDNLESQNIGLDLEVEIQKETKKKKKKR
jgi:hypothetical protein